MTFSRKTKLATSVFQDMDSKGNEFDHINPRSKGGSDDVTNCQLLTGDMNRKKSDRHRDLREWQSDFVRAWTETIKPNFLLVAIPGGGKTVAALTVAEKWLTAGIDRRLLIVVPTHNLQTQWRDEAVGFGIPLQTKEFGQNFKEGFIGAVLTYQSLRSNSVLCRRICKTPTMVILDEPHHCNQKEGWGPDTEEAFECSERRLLLSGTPFRTDGRPIPYMSYDENSRFCIPDFRYDYPDALKDGVVRRLVFDYAKGTVHISNFESQTSESVSLENTDDQAAARLRPILSANGDFIVGLIQMAHERLLSVRRTLHDAAAMAVCMDTDHAKAVARIIGEITGQTPSIIVSDDDTATSSVDSFRESTSPWLVSIRQVSEGTDIKRLHVLCYLTNITTPIFFRQLIGRVSRVRFRLGETRAPNEESEICDREAYVFLPADPRLASHAEQIEKLQIEATREETEELNRQIERGEQPSLSYVVGTEFGGREAAIISARRYGPEQISVIREMATMGGITDERAAAMYDKFVLPKVSSTPQTFPEKKPDALEVQMDRLRKQCWYLANSVARKYGLKYEQVHGRFPSQENMSHERLVSKFKTLQQWLKQGFPKE